MGYLAKASEAVAEQSFQLVDTYTPAVLGSVHKAIDLVHWRVADQRVQILRRKDGNNEIAAAEARPAVLRYGLAVHWYDQNSDHWASDFFSVSAPQDWHSLSCLASMEVS